MAKTRQKKENDILDHMLDGIDFRGLTQEAVSNLASNFQAGGRHSEIMCGASTKSRRAGPAAAVSRLISPRMPPQTLRPPGCSLRILCCTPKTTARILRSRCAAPWSDSTRRPSPASPSRRDVPLSTCGRCWESMTAQTDCVKSRKAATNVIQ